jgi:hypothetical protein
MTMRTSFTTLLAIYFVSVVACSKTQDTAPDRRVFGSPPTIQSVETDNPPWFDPKKPISCDFTQVIEAMICFLGGPSDLQAIKGGGWTNGVIDPVDSAEAGVFIEGTYGEAIFRVRASDPDSTPAQNNILLVSSSFKEIESNTEVSLVVFDDGSFNKFKNTQRKGPPGEDCKINTDGTCTCDLGVYEVSSGDQTANDGLFTRKVGMYDARTQAFLLDCILREAHETLVIIPAGSTVNFRIEAVDRQGNVATFPDNLTAVTDSSISAFKCNGDPCGCCILQNNGLPQECHQLAGMVGPSYPDGLCKAFQ